MSNQNPNRISREGLHMSVALLMSKRSQCPRKQVGCVAVKDNRIIASSYNGVLPNTSPEFGIDDEGNSRTVHAEANLIAFCAKEGIPLKGSTLYLTLSPCFKCAELIIQSGIKEVRYYNEYRCRDGIKLLEAHNIKVFHYNAVSI